MQCQTFLQYNEHFNKPINDDVCKHVHSVHLHSSLGSRHMGQHYLGAFGLPFGMQPLNRYTPAVVQLSSNASLLQAANEETKEHLYETLLAECRDTIQAVREELKSEVVRIHQAALCKRL